MVTKATIVVVEVVLAAAGVFEQFPGNSQTEFGHS